LTEDEKSLHKRKFSGKIPQTTPRITGRHIGLIALVVFSTVAAIILVKVPPKYQLSMTFLILALIACILIFRNPYIGVYLYFLYEYLRPYDLIPALLPLRLAMVIEIVTLVSWLISITNTRYGIKWSNFNWFFLGFIGVIASGVITAVNNRFAYNTFMLMMVNFVIFIISTNVVNSFERLNKLIWLLLLTHFYFALKGIYNFAVVQNVVADQVTSGIVGSGYLGDENDYALTLNVMIPFAYFMLTYSKRRLIKFISAVLLLSFVFGVISSFSRGGWVGFMAVIVYCILSSKRKLLALGYTLLLGMAFILYAPSSYWNEIKTIGETRQGTAELRSRYWEAAFRMYLNHPIAGVGAGNGKIWMPTYVTGFESPATQWGRAIHGSVPQIMAELGSLGLALYLLMLFYAVRYLYRTKKRRIMTQSDNYMLFISNSILGGIIAFLVTAIFLSTAYYPQLWTLYTLTMVSFYLQKSEGNEPHTGLGESPHQVRA
jgi:probable O-glycosylation ligase (exosortase A-associated)